MPINPAEQAIVSIAEKISRARATYPAVWRQMILDWQADGADAAWMMYSANYLLRTAGLRWAIDPFLLSTRIEGVVSPNVADDLRGIELVALTHAHGDHLDFNVLAALADQPITWIIPQHMLAEVQAQVKIPPGRVIVPQNGQPIQVGGLMLTAFNGLHFDGQQGIPSTGYQAEFDQQRWLFPGDTRVYDCSLLPQFDTLDGVFAHLWLGRACAAMPEPPLIEPFCQFFEALNPRQVVITHINELGRDEQDQWHEGHFRMVANRLAQVAPALRVTQAVTGDCVRFTTAASVS